MKSSSSNELFISAGKKPREELRLPTLHFIVADDWINKLGEKTFCYWIKLLTLVDRTDEAKSKYGNTFTVPRSLEDLYEKVFKMSKSTFYRNVIHPLWNYGLIDIVEWEDSYKLGQKPMNIIVYDYPQNSYELAVKPLVQCRDYKKDYNSNSAIFGRIGGQLRKEDSQLKLESNIENDIENDGFKNETVDEFNGFKNETVDEINVLHKIADLNNGFKNETVDGFKNETVTVSKMKPINYTNTLVNNSNTIINDSNTINLNLNQLNDYINSMKLPFGLKKYFSVRVKVLVEDSFNILDIEEFYNTSSHIKPDCSKEDIDYLNDFEFTRVVKTAYEKAQRPITTSTFGLIKSWTINALSYKRQQLLDDVTIPSSTEKNSGANNPVFFDWLDS
ncbi:hypothetical protein KM915_20925 [Cytobacillus oceanisediminis]|uniref:hypothetical protein n=1 Tax=Cytobacillus oceanisediminis TaxID=665099 RepID=UPI001C2494C1|nr:hypothetical protein [Cytobacillus oceanisediminis]MBU8732515.1 hypothetical protein [Cytobacillus oceanisediminis]